NYSPYSMGLLACCTSNLLTSLNEIIGVLHPKPPHQSTNGIIGVLYPKTPHKILKPPHQSQWDYCCDPLQNLPVSIRLLGYCTPNLLTSLNQIIGVLHANPPHQSTN